MLALIIAAATASSGAPLVMAEAGGKPKVDKVICKSFRKTQSRIGVNRVCKPRSEWEDDQRAQELELDQIKSENTINLPPDTDPF